MVNNRAALLGGPVVLPGGAERRFRERMQKFKFLLFLHSDKSKVYISSSEWCPEGQEYGHFVA
jgi:hypothetical protein